MVAEQSIPKASRLSGASMPRRGILFTIFMTHDTSGTTERLTGETGAASANGLFEYARLKLYIGDLVKGADVVNRKTFKAASKGCVPIQSQNYPPNAHRRKLRTGYRPDMAGLAATVKPVTLARLPYETPATCRNIRYRS